MNLDLYTSDSALEIKFIYKTHQAPLKTARMRSGVLRDMLSVLCSVLSMLNKFLNISDGQKLTKKLLTNSLTISSLIISFNYKNLYDTVIK